MYKELFCVFVAVISHGSAYNDNERHMRNPRNDQDWGYVQVRPAAHMFYWLYRTTSTAATSPLIMWLQGGPGGSSTGFGNFEEIGPLDIDQNPRNTTWLQAASLLFVDNPVGTGFSYVDSSDAYTTDITMIAKDLLAMFKSFLDRTPEFKKVPFYIFSESYGGKMTAAFAVYLYKAIQQGSVTCDFRGIGMGDSWISPIDSTLTWAPYLYTNSLVDAAGFTAINKTAHACAAAVVRGDWVEATNLWGATETVVEETTNNVNFYNILEYGKAEPVRKVHRTLLDRAYDKMVGPYQTMSLSELMNGPVRAQLKIIPKNVTWGGQSQEVFQKQTGDFMKSVTEVVDFLIESTPLHIVVYTGQLDLIVDTLGTEEWVYNLTIAEKFKKSSRKPILISTITSAFVKSAENFSFYWILKAGHMVPADNGPAALAMLKQIILQHS